MAESITDLTILDRLLIDSPRRPPDWRWQKAKLLAAYDQPLNREDDDDYIAVALDFKRRWDAVPDEWARVRLRKLNTSLYDAYRFYEATDPNTRCRRAGLEAYLMAPNASLKQVCDRTNLTLRLVHAYEKLFFNIRDRRFENGYLLHQVTGERIYTSVRDTDYEPIWKLCALIGGIHFLDNMIWVMEQEMLKSPALAMRYQREREREVIAKKSLLAGISFRGKDPMVQLQLLELNQRYVAMEKDIDAAAGTGDKAMDAVAQCLSKVRILVRQGAKKDLIQAHPNGLELRSDQKLLSSMGAPVTLNERQKNAAYPKAREEETTPAP